MSLRRLRVGHIKEICKYSKRKIATTKQFFADCRKGISKRTKKKENARL